MQFNPTFFGLLALAFAAPALAQYGTPASLKAEMSQGDDLVFSKEAQPLLEGVNLSNKVFAAGVKSNDKSPALVILHTCGGISQHIRDWTDAAVKQGYVVLPVDAMRGLKTDCSLPFKIVSGRFVKDALDAVAHLASLPGVDSQRISVIGFSRGALMAAWLGSSTVANTLRPGTPLIASSVAAYGLCSFPPSRARPQGTVIVQPDTDRPLMVLLGDKDLETPPESCLKLLPGLKAAGKPVQWHLYPEATHAWDSPDLDGFSKVDFKGDRVTYKYDAVVTADSRQRVFNFFAEQKAK